MNLDGWFRHNQIFTQHVYQLPAYQHRRLSPVMRFEPEETPDSIQIHIRDPHPNPEFINYYTPLVVVQEGLINTLNRFLKNFRVPQSIIMDDQGNTISAYILPNFIHSYPFLAVLPSVQVQLALLHPQGTDHEHASAIGTQAILLQYFPNPGDILNLHWLVEEDEWWNLPFDLQNTIWLQSMIHNGYWDYHAGRTRRQFLVNTVNDAAYFFLVRNSRHVGVVSDDTLIKMTALYATMVFNREISTFGTQVYPHHFTLSALTVRDILHSQILQGSDRFVFYDMNLINHVYATRGLVGLISLLFITAAMSVIALVNTILFPVLYILMVILLMYMMIARKNIGSLLLGCAKVLGLNLGVNIVSMLLFWIYRMLGTSFDIHILAVLLVALAVATVFLLIQIVKSTKLRDAPDILSVEGIIEKRKARARGA